MRAFWQILGVIVLGAIVCTERSRAAEPVSKPTPLNSTPALPESEFATDVVDDDTAPKQRLRARRQDGSQPSVGDRWRNRTPILCYVHFNDYSCGSLHSELEFLFGSCRKFFGERCLKGPPPSIVPGFDPVELGLDRRGYCPGCR